MSFPRQNEKRPPPPRTGADQKDDDGDEDDYMSNDFLNQIVDTRPGLVFNRATARKYELEKKHQQKTEQNKQAQIPVHELEEKRRNEALKTSTLTQDNKGFNLMLKMGYKMGKGLGKTDTEGDTDEPCLKKPHLEPISVVLKSDRVGLGVATENRQKLEEIKRIREQTEQTVKVSYLDKKRSNFLFRKLLHSLHKCQRVCFQLDSTRHNLKKPKLKWYWPQNIIKSLKNEEPSETSSNNGLVLKRIQDGTQEPVEETTNGSEDDSNVDLDRVYNERLEEFLHPKASHEGEKRSGDEENEDEDGELDVNSRENKLKRREEIDKNENEIEALSEREEEEDEHEDSEEVIVKKIEEICLYLRGEYLYCVWCAYGFESDLELSNNCPGLKEIDHEDE